MADTRTRLLDEAAAAVQTRGYNGFSFHDLAAAVGVKTASIHYYFPTKGDLGRALAERYRIAFLARLGEPGAHPPDVQARRYADSFRETLASGRMCLCGILAAEIDTQPAGVREEIRAFFDENRAWLAAALSGGAPSPDSEARAEAMVAALEGAMLAARVDGGEERFRRIAEVLLARLA
jgi:TetR/AcrR family transcriptional regulator, transcriptional repressor for nem operon